MLVDKPGRNCLGQAASRVRGGALDHRLPPTVPRAPLRLRRASAAPAPAAYVRVPDLRAERLDQDDARIADADRCQRYDYTAPAFGFRRAPGHGRSSRTTLTGVWATCRNWLKPASSASCRIAAGPAWAPSAIPPGWARAAGVHWNVDAA